MVWIMNNKRNQALRGSISLFGDMEHNEKYQLKLWCVVVDSLGLYGLPGV